MKKNIIIVLLLLVTLILFWLRFSSDAQTSSAEKSYFPIGLSAKGDITCSYPQILYGSYKDNRVVHELPKPETNPLIMTFSDLQEKVAKIKFIDATRTISEVPVVKLYESDEKVILVEGSGDAYVALHTIFKDTGVSVYTKEVSLLGTPVGTLSMGTCLDS